MKRTLWVLVILSMVLPNAAAGQLTRLAHFNLNEGKRNFYLSPDGSKIAYELYTNSTYNTCIMDLDTKMIVRLSNPKKSEWNLHWSTDGKRIAYTGNDGIHIVNIDGSSDIRITEVGVLADWSPDGGKIAFTAPVDGNYKIFTCDVDGSHIKRLTSFSGYELNPLWSPDGTKIVFVNVDKTNRVCVTNSDGTESLMFPQEWNYVTNPCWSPDGMRISFEGKDNSTSVDNVYMQNYTGTQLRNLTQRINGVGFCTSSSWSSDGKRIVFNSYSAHLHSMYSIDTESFQVSQMVVNMTSYNFQWFPEGDRVAFISDLSINTDIYVLDFNNHNWPIYPANSGYCPLWSPDGEKIAFLSFRDAEKEIYSMDANRLAQTRLTYNKGNIEKYVWSPDGNKMAYMLQDIVNDIWDNMRNIFVVNMDGIVEQKLSTTKEIFDFTWLSDGENLSVMLYNDSYPFGISIRNTNEINDKYFADGIHVREAHWSPDRKKILVNGYISSASQQQLWVMNSDGTDLKHLSPSELISFENLQWSPDNSKVSFIKRENVYQGAYGIDVIDISNADHKTIYSYTWEEPLHISNGFNFYGFYYCWSPDCKKIALQNIGTDNFDIYVIDADGSNLTQLTSSPENDLAPCWSPDGTKIAYQTFVDSEWVIRILDLNNPLEVNDSESQFQPHAFVLSQNRPNPFNPSTSIEFSLPAAGDVRLEVFNSAGQLLDVLAEGKYTAGAHLAVWNTAGKASGTYFYRLRCGGFMETKKMVLVR